MKHKAFGPRSRQLPDVSAILRITAALSESGCDLEDRFWRRQLTVHVDALLRKERDEVIIQALDRTHADEGRGYDVLVDVVEACAESRQFEAQGERWDLLLVACPILAWSRYSIHAGPIPPDTLQAISNQLGAHVLASSARHCLADFLFSPDQLPQSYTDTRNLTALLGEAAINGVPASIDADNLPPTGRFLSDVRYLLLGVASPADGPLFRWQEGGGMDRTRAFAAWEQQGSNALAPLFAGASIEVLLPDAYHSAGRASDRASRVHAVKSAAAFLQSTLNLPAAALGAVIAPCSDRDFEELRVSFLRGSDVVHGVVWPLFGNDEDAADQTWEVESLLTKLGLGQVEVLNHNLPREYCDECGAPLYPNRDADMVHAELPGEADASRPTLLH